MPSAGLGGAELALGNPGLIARRTAPIPFILFTRPSGVPPAQPRRTLLGLRRLVDELDTGTKAQPWLDWHAANTQRRSWPAGGRCGKPVCERAADLKQMVFDWPTSRTGWKKTPRRGWCLPRKRGTPPQTPEKLPADGKWRRRCKCRSPGAGSARAVTNVLGAYIGHVDVMRPIAATARVTAETAAACLDRQALTAPAPDRPWRRGSRWSDTCRRQPA